MEWVSVWVTVVGTTVVIVVVCVVTGWQGTTVNEATPPVAISVVLRVVTLENVLQLTVTVEGVAELSEAASMPTGSFENALLVADGLSSYTARPTYVLCRIAFDVTVSGWVLSDWNTPTSLPVTVLPETVTVPVFW